MIYIRKSDNAKVEVKEILKDEYMEISGAGVSFARKGNFQILLDGEHQCFASPSRLKADYFSDSSSQTEHVSDNTETE